MSEASQFDLLVIGGGINGAAIARDAAGRGLRVLLVEQDDLASGTSSRSSKLIHGGLRYLETYQFRLVREALQEREVMLRAAPHIIHPLQFILPQVSGMRPGWMLSLGLWLYDHIGGRISLPHSGRMALHGTPQGQPLRDGFTQGFHYSDCWVEDMRLVTLNALDAAGRGASIRTRTAVTALQAVDGQWVARLNKDEEVRARVVINAAGPWVGDVLNLTRGHTKPPIRLIKGSHIVVPRLYSGNWAYLCQNDDGRVVFFLPYERDFTLIGTTDIPFEGNPAAVTCSAEERDYLLGVAARFFKLAPSSLAVIHSFAGVRSLFDDGAAKAKDITRDYVLKLDEAPAPLLSVYGGKITTCRRLAEHAIEKLRHSFPQMPGPWTAEAMLPGGDLCQPFDEFVIRLQERWPWLPPQLLYRWCRQYGSRVGMLVGSSASLHDLGQQVLPGLYEAEIDYLITHEFARTAEDILWRRTRLGLRVTQAQTQILAQHLAKSG